MKAQKLRGILGDFSEKTWLNTRQSWSKCPFSSNSKNSRNRTDNWKIWWIIIEDWWKSYNKEKGNTTNMPAQQNQHPDKDLAMYYFYAHRMDWHDNPLEMHNWNLLYTRQLQDNIIEWIQSNDIVEGFDTEKKKLFSSHIRSILLWNKSEKDSIVQKCIKHVDMTDNVDIYFQTPIARWVLYAIHDTLYIYFTLAIKSEETVNRILWEEELKILNNFVHQHSMILSMYNRTVAHNFFTTLGDNVIVSQKDNTLKIDLDPHFYNKHSEKWKEELSYIQKNTQNYDTGMLFLLLDELKKNSHSKSPLIYDLIEISGDWWYADTLESVRDKVSWLTLWSDRAWCPALKKWVLKYFLEDLTLQLQNMYATIRK